MKSIFGFASHAAWECDFCWLQHLSSEDSIFLFFRHLPSENHQNEENRTSKPCCGGVSAEGATSKIGSKSASCPGIYDRDTFFNFTKKVTNRFNNVCHPPGISMITTSGRLANFIHFHNNKSQNLKNYNDFSNFNYSGFFSNLMPSQDAHSSVWSLADLIPGCGVLK